MMRMLAPARTPVAPRPAGVAFTLIELLVVITIIAVLASMLMVALKVVRNAANNSTCASNQRGIAMAIHAYAIDNEGALPYRNNNSEWFSQAINYLESQYQVAPQKHRRDVFHCPFAVAEIANPWLFSFRFSSHYGMNDHIRVSWNGGGYWNGTGTYGTASYRPQPPLQIASLPTNLVLLTENKAWSGGLGVYFEDAVSYTTTGPWPVGLNGAGGAVAPIIWHAKTVNFVCVDGHTERVTGTWDQAVMQPRFKTSASIL